MGSEPCVKDEDLQEKQEEAQSIPLAEASCFKKLQDIPWKLQ